MCVTETFLDVPIEMPDYYPIARCLGDMWEELAMHFSIDPSGLDGRTEEKKKVSFLKNWKQGEADDATFRALINALDAINCKHDACELRRLAKR